MARLLFVCYEFFVLNCNDANRTCNELYVLRIIQTLFDMLNSANPKIHVYCRPNLRFIVVKTMGYRIYLEKLPFNVSAVSSFFTDPKFIIRAPSNRDWYSGHPMETVLLATGSIIAIEYVYTEHNRVERRNSSSQPE